MALLKKNKQNEQDDQKINIEDDVKISYGERQYSAKDRKPIQLDPPVLQMIRNISYAKDLPMYKVVEVAMQSYLDTLNESEKIIYDARNRK